MAGLGGMGTRSGGIPLLVVLALTAGCASDGGVAARDSTLSPCQAQYREHRNQAPAPTGMSDQDRARYEEATRDYHVSRGCQREAEVTHTVPIWPRPGRK